MSCSYDARVKFAAALALAVAACAPPPAPVRPAPPPVRPEFRVSSTECVAQADVADRIHTVLAAHRAMQSGLRFDVGTAITDGAVALSLRVVRPSGEVGLDRRFELAAADCASAAQLLALSVDRWLSAFPEWAVPPPAAPPPPQPARWTEIALGGALNGMWSPFGLEAQVGALVDHGARTHRFGGGALVRASLPQEAGTGRFQQLTLLGAASWRARVAPAWELIVSARAGGLLVSGIGFGENHSSLLPWWEGAVFGGRRFAWGALGLEVAASALQHRAVTADGLVSEDIPLLRVGFSGVWGVRTHDP